MNHELDFKALPLTICSGLKATVHYLAKNSQTNIKCTLSVPLLPI